MTSTANTIALPRTPRLHARHHPTVPLADRPTVPPSHHPTVRPSNCPTALIPLLTVLLLVTTLSPVNAAVNTDYPVWWTARSAVSASDAAADYAVCNSGQLKYMALQAMREFDATLPGGAGITISNMVNAWISHPENAQDYSAINAGQLKAVAAPFYDRLKACNWPCILPQNMTTNQDYPWSGSSSTPQDYSMANNGQVKYVFSFSVVKLKSTTAATTPSDQSRTNLGIGEVVYLNTAPVIPNNKLSWTATSGTLIPYPNQGAYLKVTSTGTVTVSARLADGLSLTKSFNVLAPANTVGFSKTLVTSSTSSFMREGIAGAGMIITIQIEPTNVNFSSIYVEELSGGPSTNATGYFADTNVWPISFLDHANCGAFHWGMLDDENKWYDQAELNCTPPWGMGGSLTISIPGAWGMSEAETNTLPWSDASIGLTSNGTVTLTKFNFTIQRGTNDVYTLQ